MWYRGTNIGVFYKNYKWVADWFKELLNKLDPVCIHSAFEELSGFCIYLKDGTTIRSYRANESSRGVALDKAFVEPGIPRKTIDMVIKKYVKIPQIVIEYEEFSK